MNNIRRRKFRQRRKLADRGDYLKQYTGPRGKINPRDMLGFAVSDMIEFACPKTGLPVYGKIIEFKRTPEGIVAEISVKATQDETGTWAKYHDFFDFKYIPVEELEPSSWGVYKERTAPRAARIMKRHRTILGTTKQPQKKKTMIRRPRNRRPIRRNRLASRRGRVPSRRPRQMRTRLATLHRQRRGDFMEPEIYRDWWVVIYGPYGGEAAPAEYIDVDEAKALAQQIDRTDEAVSLRGTSLEDFFENHKAYEIEVVQGYGARMQAPGYMDSTTWTVFDTEREAEEYLREMYMDEDEEW